PGSDSRSPPGEVNPRQQGSARAAGIMAWSGPGRAAVAATVMVPAGRILRGANRFVGNVNVSHSICRSNVERHQNRADHRLSKGDEVMEKDQFIATLVKRVNASHELATTIVDATLAELMAPIVFGPPGQLRAKFDNNCNNNCAAELAAK